MGDMREAIAVIEEGRGDLVSAQGGGCFWDAGRR